MADLDDNLRQIAEDLFMRGVGSAGLEDIEDADDRDKALLNLQAHYSTEAIAQIKQAFADEGYVQPDQEQLNNFVNQQQELMRLKLTPTPKHIYYKDELPTGVSLMSGQEWYDRYQAEIEKMNESTDFKAELARIKELYPGFKAHEAAVLYTASKLEEAAKRASGLEADAD